MLDSAQLDTELSQDQILAVQGLAIRTGNQQLLHLAWAALGYDSRIAFYPATPEQRQRGLTACREALQIQARLARAESEDDQAMRYRCRAALAGDVSALASYRATTEMERLTGGVR